MESVVICAVLDKLPVPLQIDRDGPSILLRGLQAVWQTVATLTLLVLEPFPHHAFESP